MKSSRRTPNPILDGKIRILNANDGDDDDYDDGDDDDDDDDDVGDDDDDNDDDDDKCIINVHTKYLSNRLHVSVVNRLLN